MINLPKNVNLTESPYRYFLSEYQIEDNLYHNIKNWLDRHAPWSLVKESFYTQYEFSFQHADLPEFLNFIVSDNYLQTLKKSMEEIYKVELLDKFDVVGHLLTQGHVIKIHNDYIQETYNKARESHRLLMHFNSNWTIDNGGLCMFFSSCDANDIVDIAIPTGKLLNSFEISNMSYHAVSQIQTGRRKTIIFTFYSE